MESTDKKIKIKVDKLRKCFGDLEVLKDISTEITEGEVVVILGPSGSGKSTFLRCLNRLEDATAGTIIVDDIDITAKKVNMNKVRENIGMVFQHFNLFNNMNVLDNLMLAPLELKKADKKEARARAEEMLKRVYLLEMADSFGAGLGKKVEFVYLSQVMPYAATACKLGLGLCWKAGIAAEVIGIPTGSIGEKLYKSKVYLETPDLFAWTIVIIFVSMTFEKIFLFFLKKITGEQP